MDHIQILFKEYDTLRAEILGRANNLFQLLTVAIVAMGWLLSHPQDTALPVALCVSIFAILAFGVLIWRAVHLAARRLRELEREINGLAGKDLLKWETSWGEGWTVILRWPKSK